MKKCRKPDRGGKAAGSVAGAACEGGPRTCRGKALRAGEAVGVDAPAGEAVLAPRGILVFYQGYGGARQGASEVEIAALRSVDNAGWARLPQIRGAPVSLHRERECAILDRSWATPSSVSSPGVGLPKGGPTQRSHGLSSETLKGAVWRRSSRREPRARESSD